MKLFDDLMKKMGNSPEIAKEEDMSVEDKAVVELSVHEATVAELSALKDSFAEQAAQVASMNEQLEAANAALAEAKAAVEAVAEEKAAVEAAAVQAKMDARMAQIVDAVGTAKADGLMEATKELSDEAFAAVVGAMSANIDVEAETELFNETGVDAQPNAQEEKKPVHFKNFIKTK